jgi:farnesyl-diphosphate farnesyltransferase
MMSPDGQSGTTGQVALSTVHTPDRMHDLLTKSSRTFALNIPLLPEPTRCEVTVAYLFFRVADTLEDSTLWSRQRKIEELGRFAALLRQPDRGSAEGLAADWQERPPCDHPGYLELLAELPLVVQVHFGLAADSQKLVVDHTLRTIEGMSSFLEREDGSELQLRDIKDLQDYCYAVAGIVGEMLTELFLKDDEALEPVAPILRGLAARFGEALQLVNILKDSTGDSDEGRHFLPAGRSSAEVFSLARDDLGSAARYVTCLAQAGAVRGVVAFTALPLLLAKATIDRVEQDGPGSKISRIEVAQIIEELNQALDDGSVPALLGSF